MDELGGERKHTRKYTRTAFAQPVSLFHRGRFAFARAVDIGEGGLRLSTAHPFMPGEIFEIGFEVTGERLHSVIAQVCHTGEQEVGIRFLESDGRLAVLQAEIRSLLDHG